jgi:hypothetical protein
MQTQAIYIAHLQLLLRQIGQIAGQARLAVDSGLQHERTAAYAISICMLHHYFNRIIFITTESQ